MIRMRWGAALGIGDVGIGERLVTVRVGHRLGGDGEHRPGVGEHMRDPLGGVFGIERQICPAGLVYGQNRDEDIGRTGQIQRGDIVGAQTPRDRVACEPVGPTVHLVERQLPRAVDDRQSTGSGAHLGFEQRGQRCRRGGELGAVLPSCDPVRLGFDQHVDIGQPDVRVLRHPVEHRHQTGQQRVDGRRLEQIGIVFHCEGD